jgi:amino acid adenylation domain-containing protein
MSPEEAMPSEYSDARRSLLEKYLRGELSLRPAPETIPRRKPDDPVPLSYSQEQVWMHAQMVPDVPLYNEPVTIHYSGALDAAALERSFNEILRRHEAWRTCFIVVDGAPRQIVKPELSISLPVIDLRHLPKEERDSAALTIATEDARKPLDLSQLPLFRARLMRLEDKEYRLYLTLSHIIFDGVAIYRVLLPELATLYKAYAAGQPSPLPDPAIQYPDFACWQRRTDSGETLAKDRDKDRDRDKDKDIDFWQQQLNRNLSDDYLPVDRPHKRELSFRGSMSPFKLSKSLTAKLRALCRAENVSLFHVLFAGFAALLRRYSGEEVIPIGSVTAGRNRPETEALLGYFLNTVVFACDVSGDPTFKTLMKRLRNLTLDVLEHDRLPFEHLIRELKVQRNPGRNPLFQALFSLEPPLPELDPAWRLTQMDVDTGASKYDLSLELDERSEEVLARFHYSTDLFDEPTVVRMAGHWQNLLEAAVGNPEQRISELALLGTHEKHQLLVEWNQTDVDLSAPPVLHKLFEDQVERTPDAQAVIFEGKHLTYRELDSQANQVARHLKNLGVGPEVPVALYFERSIEMLVGIFGVLKAGGACVPLDPASPHDRLAFMMAETQAPVLLTHSSLQSQLPPGKAQVICLDTFRAERGESIESLPPCHVGANNTAYIIYTSGSTGQPKGVRVLHGGLVNSTLARSQFYAEPLRSFLLLSSFTFDSSVAGIFWSLSVGGTLVLPPDQSRWDLNSLSLLVEEHKVSHLLCVPSLYKALLETGPVERWASLEVAIVAGESCPPDLVNQHYKRLPDAVLYNEYGPTEATVWCCAYKCDQQAKTLRVPIGRPIANTRLYVLDEHRQIVPVGVAGELYVGGVGVAGGYWDRPALTAEKFIADPFAQEANARLYRTGDAARFLRDGNIEYLGRVDDQVKIRGFRVELGEIEAVLARHPAVREAVVVVREDVSGEKRLAAYYTVSETSGPPVEARELRSHLSGQLPDYMVPAAFVQLSRMPVMVNGKLDRKALPAPEETEYAGRDYEAPVGDIETRLAEIWADVLKIARVGRQDNFFELGGHSLLGLRLIERMRQQGIQVSVRALFLTPTLEGLAAAAEKSARAVVPENLIPMASEVIKPDMLPLVELSQEEIDRIVKGVPGGARNVQDIYPLAPLQEGILFHHLLGTEGDPYLLATLISFDTRERLNGYVEAMQKVIDRHDILRTAVMWEGLREPIQVVQRKVLLSVEEIKLEAAGGDISRQLYARYDPRHHRIDVRQAPLLRLSIAYDEKKDRWVMIELFHHLAGDHVTLEVMQEEVQAHLAGRAESLPIPRPFRNLVAQARSAMKRPEHEEYFHKLLGDVDEPTAPFGLLDVQGDGTGIEEAHVLLDDELSRRMRERARRLGVSAASVCHLAWAQVLARVSGRDDVVFGTVLFGRMEAGQSAERVMGLFINTLPVRINVSEEGAEASVKQVHAQLGNLLQHEHASLALAQRCSAVAAPTPLFSALLNYRHSGGTARAYSEEMERAWEGIELLHVEERTSYPFTLSVDDLADSFTLTVQTVASVGAKRVCEYMQRALEGLVEALESEPGRAVRTLDVMPAAERKQVLFKFNHTAAEYPRDRCIQQLFEEQVLKSPQATAVVFEETSLTYAELNARANQLAHFLRELGVKPDTRVGICVERGLDMLVGLLAILKAGGAYVPLDPNYPAARLQYMLEDSAPAVLLTQRHLRKLFTKCIATLPVVDLADPTPAWRDEPTTNPDPDSMGLTAQHLAYIIYTSGSTGQPKGVGIEHGNAVNFISWAKRSFTSDDLERTLFSTSLNFDLAVYECFVPLTVGTTVKIVRDVLDMARARIDVTLINTVPSAMSALVEAGGLPSSVRLINLAGEPLKRTLVERVLATSKVHTICNLYGPTETTTYSTWVAIRRGEPFAPHIGHPIANTQIYILDSHGEAVPVGVTGELYIGGAGVARGYFNQPELTTQRFLADPFVGETGARMYRTGDLGKWLADGTIEYLGRNDHQIKIRGFRIELGEIEATLASHPALKEAVVVVREDVPGEKRLVAYYTASEMSGRESSAEKLRSHLSSRLPEYMVPAAFVRLDQMPLLENGKLDRKALPAPAGDAYAAREYESPQGEIEKRLAEILSDVLKVERIGRQHNFFELGGHSLLAMQVMARICREFDVELGVRIMFEEPTIAGLGIEVEKARATGIKSRTPVLERRPRPAAVLNASREALLAQLDTLSGDDVQTLLKDFDARLPH